MTLHLHLQLRVTIPQNTCWSASSSNTRLETIFRIFHNKKEEEAFSRLKRFAYL